MTDAELAKAVADACGIAVYDKGGFLWLANGVEFTPATSWNSAFLAAEKCGFLTGRGVNISRLSNGDTRLQFWSGDTSDFGCKVIINASGPRAICEAILAVTKGEK